MGIYIHFTIIFFLQWFIYFFFDAAISILLCTLNSVFYFAPTWKKFPGNNIIRKKRKNECSCCGACVWKLRGLGEAAFTPTRCCERETSTWDPARPFMLHKILAGQHTLRNEHIFNHIFDMAWNLICRTARLAAFYVGDPVQIAKSPSGIKLFGEQKYLSLCLSVCLSVLICLSVWFVWSVCSGLSVLVCLVCFFWSICLSSLCVLVCLSGSSVLSV